MATRLQSEMHPEQRSKLNKILFCAIIKSQSNGTGVLMEELNNRFVTLQERLADFRGRL